MKRISVLFFLLLFFVAGISQTTPKGLQANDKAPLFTAKDQNGNAVSLLKMLQK
ncbi:MAG: hypothetical protein M3R72_08625 [Bacteroidota bacterium]|nr:hypothetical protein [Bacteroidota bacterium]